MRIRPELKLEVLDWGGHGHPLLFLPGLGNSAHVFDDFAPRFLNQFHVLAVTPRGFGASTHLREGYAIASLAEDVKLVLNNLDLRQVNIAAHSYGGGILSVFAARYGDCVHRIVYLDGAYDYTALPVLKQKAPFPTRPPMTESDRASVAAVRAYDARNILFPEAETRAIYRFDTGGKLLRDVTPASVSDLVLQGASRPPYRDIRAHALAIFAVPSVVTDYFPFYSELDNLNQERAFLCFTARLAWIKEQQALFRAECKECEVVELYGAHHYVFISHADSVEDSLRRFLRNE